ncbi:MAG: type VI secretion system tip protein VgrG [Myxococcales bacterium]|nr:type VI secretion system tip protein VgrG [Myxococcales bacterium]
MGDELQDRERGNKADYVLGTVEGWGAFDVVRWHAVEEISRPFEVEIVVLRRAERGAVILEELLDTGATLRIATEGRWRQVHGVLAEVELLDHTPEFYLYRLLLVPHLSRALYRRRCRTFVDLSVKDIVSSVLENTAAPQLDGAGGLAGMAKTPAPGPAEPSFGEFVEPDAVYRWVLVEDQSVTAKRPQIVQFNETDLAFVSRLLEMEGVSFFFEHAEHTLVMTITDRPGHAPLFERDASHDLVRGTVGGAARHQEVLRSLHEARRLRPHAVRCRDYDWNRSTAIVEATAEVRGAGPRELEHFEYRVAVPNASSDLPAQWRADRFDDERALGRGTSTVRTLEPGYRFRVTDRDGVRDEAEYLLVRVETFATELRPEATVLEHLPFGVAGLPPPTTPGYQNRFEVLSASRRFRPERATPKPMIHGVDTARVTAEEIAAESPPPELNSDAQGRVRVRFHWDQRRADGRPTSKWLRVSQGWAGAGFGAMYVPRVGHEVLVAYERGDPDRPLVVGRVYNAQNPPPYDGTNATKSTLKSDSVGADGSSADGYNELRFEDRAGQEQVYLQAERNLDELVKASHSTTVGGDQSNSVGGDQSNTVHGSRTHHVAGTELVHVEGNRTTQFDSNEAHVVSGMLTTQIGADESRTVVANRTTTITATETLQCTDRSTLVKASDTREVGGQDQIEAGSRTVHVKGPHHASTDASYISNAAAEHKFTSPAFAVLGDSVYLCAGSATLAMSSGMVVLNNGAGASVALVGGLAVIQAAGAVVAKGGGTANLVGGGLAGVQGGAVVLSGGSIDAKAGTIKLNG